MTYFLKKNIKNAAIGAGQIRDYSKRYKIYDDLRKIGYSLLTTVTLDASINESVPIAEGTVVMNGVVVHSDTKLCRFSILCTHYSIDHNCKIGDFVHVAPSATLSGRVKIGNKVFLGAGATIIQYKSVGKNCIIGEGAVAIRNIPDYVVVVGAPTKIAKCKKREEKP